MPTPCLGTLWLRQMQLPLARVGVHAHERETRQPVEIDLGLEVDLGPAALSDRLDDTIDWAHVHAVVEQAVLSRHFNLIESLAMHLAELILRTFPVQRVHCEVRKLKSLSSGTAAVSLTHARPAAS